MKASGCAQFAVAIIGAILLWGGFKYWQVSNDNAEAQEVFERLCQPENLYVSGTFDNWMAVYDSIRQGTFDDPIHLINWKKDAMGRSEFPVGENEQILTSEFTISFMNSDELMTLRDFVMRQKDFGISLLDDGVTHFSCISDHEPELDRWRWSNRGITAG